MSEPQKDIYGKVTDGVIVEFPVTVDIILNRGHNVNDYCLSVFATEPNYNRACQKLQRKISVRNGKIYVDFEITPRSLAEVLAGFKTKDGVMDIKDVEFSLMVYTKSLFTNYVEDSLDKLCNLRGYTSLNNILARYRNSSIESFKKESDYLQVCLDNAWKVMTVYQADLMTGKQPLPTSIDELDAVLNIPKNWDDFTS